MRKKSSLLLSIIFTLTFALNAGAINTFGAPRNTKKANKKVIEKKQESVTKKQKQSEITTPAQVISVDKAIGDNANWLKKRIASGDYKINDWFVIALSLAGEDIGSDAYKRSGKGYIDYKKETISEQTTTGTAITMYAKNVMGLMAAGQDPSYFEGHDLLQELAMKVKKSDDTVTGQAWGVISLCSAGFDFNTESAAKSLESKQNKDGGYGWMAGAASDADTTAMIVYALNMCGKDKNEISVKKALTYLKKTLSDMEKEKSKENVESLSQILMSVISSNDNLNNYKINNKDLYNEILGFRNSDGGFTHLKSGSSNDFSTYQTLIALEFYKNHRNVYEKLKNNIKNALTPISANIRIEGPDKTIINEILTLNNRIVFDYNGKAFDSKKITAYAYLMKALNKDEISSVSDYGYGAPYVSTIDNVKGGKFGGWDGWMFLVNGVDPGDAMTNVEIKNGDNILVFYGDYGISPITLEISKDVKAGQNLNVKAIVSGKTAKGISIIVNGSKVGSTDENGLLSYKLEKSGDYKVYGENNDTNGKPINIRSEITTITIK